MRKTTPIFGVISFLGLAITLPAFGQFTPYQQGNNPPNQPRAVPQPPSTTTPANPYLDRQDRFRGGSITSTPDRSVRRSPSPTGYYPAGGYPFGGVYVENPYGGYLRGVADVIDARGRYGIDYTRARIVNQQAEQEKIKTRRMLLDQRRYEQAMRPTANQIREYEQREALRRALNEPPLPEIVSGASLNVLLANAKKMHSQGLYGPSVPVDSDLLSRINVTVGSGGNVGIFKDRGTLSWPAALRTDAFKQDRERIETLTKRIVDQAQRGEIPSASVDELAKTVKSLESSVQNTAKGMSLSDLIAAKRYVRELEQGVKGLRNPSSANFFNAKWSAKGRNVGEVISYMTKQGLVFAPAVRGDESSYRALHQLMVSYDVGLNALARKNDSSRDNR